jgi:hypothetical protein
MTVETLKEYLKALKFEGVTISYSQEIVDAAAEAAFGKVWEAHIWKIGRKLDTSLRTVADQAYTIMPKDMSGIGTVRLISGTKRRKIAIVDEGNFDESYPNPAALSTTMPTAAKLVYHSPTKTDMWRLYWDRVPDGVYEVHVSYRFEATLSFLPNLPGHMVEPVMLAGSALILPPGPTLNNQMLAAQASLRQAISGDEKFTGIVDVMGGDPGWDDYSHVSRGGSIWDPHS